MNGVPPSLDPRTWMRSGTRGLRSVVPAPAPVPRPKPRPVPPLPAPPPNVEVAPEPRGTVIVAEHGPSLRSKLLLAECALPQPFSRQELVLAAWTRYPMTFGLKGHHEHPDSNAVLAKLWGQGNLLWRGWLEYDRERVDLLRVTAAGRRAAREHL